MALTDDVMAELREKWNRETAWTLANVACPRCGAPAGKVCASRDRYLNNGMHAARHSLASKRGYGER